MKTQKREDELGFRLIAIRPLGKCVGYIRKILKENELYIFYQDYQEGFNKTPLKKNISQTIPRNFYAQQESVNDFEVNISAIVGKNGDGKSSLIELSMRILNNFAYLAGYKSIHDDLHFVEGVHAELYYEIRKNSYDSITETSLYLIRIEGDNVYWIDVSGADEKQLGYWVYKRLELNQTNLEIIKGHEHLLFYTQVVNYSLYAYNIADFTREHIGERFCWLDGIFHKNDGYQTPIVLNPFRQKGIIDINKENSLAKSRLVELFLNDCQYGEKIVSTSYRKVDDKLQAKSIDTKLKLHTKEQEYVYDFIGRTLYSDTSYGTVADIEGNIITLLDKEKKSYSLKGLEFIYNAICQLSNLIGEQSALNKVDRLNRWEIILKDYLKIEKIERYESEIDRILESTDRYVRTLLNSSLKIKDSEKNKIEEIKTIVEKLRSSTLSKFNFRQLQRLALINYSEDKWNEVLPQAAINKKIESLLKSYLIYKTISIIDKYPDYEEYASLDERLHHLEFLRLGELSENLKDVFNKAFGLIINDIEEHKTHVTLKLRRALTFIYINPFRNNDEFINKHLDDQNKWNGMPFSVPLFNYYSIVKDLIGKTIPLTSFDIKDINLQELLPPPIFIFDIGFEFYGKSLHTCSNPNLKDQILLSDLSSGQRQLLYFVSSVIYHLRNLNSIKNKKTAQITIKYSHINLIFEEVELYFHPEYQRILINYLLTSLTKVHLPDISSINMCFSTHSPFILSDIPKQNVLMLQDGKMISTEINTFGANVTDLLANTFFLEKSLIGEFAYQKIREVIEWLDKPTKDNNNYYRNIIKLIDERIVQRKLSEMYDEKMAESLEIELIDRQISYLEKLKENALHKS